MLTRPISTYTLDDELISYTYEQEQDSYFYVFELDPDCTTCAANNIKKEQFMKSPLVIYNHCYAKGVIETAYVLRQQLELEAKDLRTAGGPYIRPMMLLVINGSQAMQDLALYELKMQFIQAGIKQAEIKIKGNVIDELQGVNVMKENCEVRYVITVNDLQEQWRCPFVYVLASLGNRAFAMDIKAPVHCLLPHPYSITTTHPLLNAGYVLTASSQFQELTSSIRSQVQDLNFSDAELRIKDNMIELLKRISIFEILRSELNNGMEGIDLKKKSKDNSIVREIKNLVLAG